MMGRIAETELGRPRTDDRLGRRRHPAAVQVVRFPASLAALLAASAELALPWVVAGRSMEPELRPSDRLLDGHGGQ